MLAIGLICVVVGFIAGYRCRLSLERMGYDD